jgi:hypothetical protein
MRVRMFLLVLQETEVRRQRRDLAGRQSTRDIGHRMSCKPVVSVVPLLESSLQVGVGEPPQAGNLPDALSPRAVAGSTGYDIGTRNSVLKYRPSGCDEFPISVVGCSGVQLGKVIRQGACRLRADVCSGMPHVQLRERIIAFMFAEARELILNVLPSLSRQAGCGSIALRRGSMAPGAVPNVDVPRAPRQRGRSKGDHRQHRYSQADALHVSSLHTFWPTNRRKTLFQITDVGCDGFYLTLVQAVRDRFHDD